MNSSTCYQFSLSVKKWKKKNFLRKNEIFANEGLYYRFFVTLKPILYWSMRYQFYLSLKIRKKTIFHEKMRFFHRRINSSSFLLCWSWICPFRRIISASYQLKKSNFNLSWSVKLKKNQIKVWKFFKYLNSTVLKRRMRASMVFGKRKLFALTFRSFRSIFRFSAWVISRSDISIFSERKIRTKFRF